MKLTQKQIILEWIDDQGGSIIPAKMGGKKFMASDAEVYIWPACGMRRCQEMTKGENPPLVQVKEGKFGKFMRRNDVTELLSQGYLLLHDPKKCEETTDRLFPVQDQLLINQ